MNQDLWAGSKVSSSAPLTFRRWLPLNVDRYLFSRALRTTFLHVQPFRESFAYQRTTFLPQTTFSGQLFFCSPKHSVGTLYCSGTPLPKPRWRLPITTNWPAPFQSGIPGNISPRAACPGTFFLISWDIPSGQKILARKAPTKNDN